MSDWIALLATVGVLVSILVGRVFYLRRVRQGRADPVIDPSWPSTARPQLYPGRTAAEHRDQPVLRPGRIPQGPMTLTEFLNVAVPEQESRHR